jgi:hypothetical protein
MPHDPSPITIPPPAKSPIVLGYQEPLREGEESPWQKSPVAPLVLSFAMGGLLGAAGSGFLESFIAAFGRGLDIREAVSVAIAWFGVVSLASAFLAFGLSRTRKFNRRFVLGRPYRSARVAGICYSLTPSVVNALWNWVILVPRGLDYRGFLLVAWLFLVPALCVVYFGVRATRGVRTIVPRPDGNGCPRRD